MAVQVVTMPSSMPWLRIWKKRKRVSTAILTIQSNEKSGVGNTKRTFRSNFNRFRWIENEWNSIHSILTIHLGNSLVVQVDSLRTRIVPYLRWQSLGMADAQVCTIPTSIRQMPMYPMPQRNCSSAAFPVPTIWLDDFPNHRRGNCNLRGIDLEQANYRPILLEDFHQYWNLRWTKNVINFFFVDQKQFDSKWTCFFCLNSIVNTPFHFYSHHSPSNYFTNRQNKHVINFELNTYTQLRDATSLWSTRWLCKWPKASANWYDIMTIWIVVSVREDGSCRNSFRFFVPLEAAYKRNGVEISSMETPSNDRMAGCDAPYRLMPSCNSKLTWFSFACWATVFTSTFVSSLYVPRKTRPKFPSCNRFDKRTRYRLIVSNSFESAVFVAARSLIRSLRGNVEVGAGGNTIDGGADGGWVCKRWKLDVRSGWLCPPRFVPGLRAQYAIEIKMSTNINANTPPMINVNRPVGATADIASSSNGSSMLLLVFSTFSLYDEKWDETQKGAKKKEKKKPCNKSKR